MARRLDVELTSTRPDGMFTWRAAGAKHPKGELSAHLVPEGVGVGDVVRVEAEAELEGLTVTTVFAPKGPRPEAERIELIRAGPNEPAVTAALIPRRRSRRDASAGAPKRQRAGKRQDGPAKSRPRDGRERRKLDREPGARRKRDREPDRRRQRHTQSEGRRAGKVPAPSAPRLRPSRTHRKAALEALPEAQRELAAEVLRGGVPGLRDTLVRMNALAAQESIPEINSRPLVALAEQLAPGLKAAEWRDRAEAAEAGLSSVDLRDLRSVVSAADSGARGEESAALADRLRVGLAERVESEHRAWLNELAGLIAEGRAIRALRLSSHPPKAGSPLPVDLAKRLADLAAAGLTPDNSAKRWAMLLEAIAFSPVRAQVTAEGVPPETDEDLLKTVRKLASRIPDLARLFDIEPAARKRRRAAPPPPPPADQASPEAPAEAHTGPEPASPASPEAPEDAGTGPQAAPEPPDGQAEQQAADTR